MLKKGYLLGLVCLFLGAYNVYMLLTNTDILKAWYCLCLVAAITLATISLYNAERWENQKGDPPK
jgi:fumarate reductase subunit C